MTNPENIPSQPDESKEEGATPVDRLPSNNNSSSGKEQENDDQTARATEVESAPMVPLKSSAPDRTVVSIMENPSVLEALVHEAPEEVIRFVESADDRQFRYYSQKEANRHKELLAGENTKRIAILGVIAVVFGGFAYSTFTHDSALPTQVITVIVAGFGGLGVRELFKRKEEE